VKRRSIDEQLLPKQRLASKLRCCLQDPRRPAPPGKSLLQNALDQKLGCCLQDQTSAVPDHAGVVSAGSRRLPAGGNCDTSANNQDGWTAISEDYPDKPAGTLHPRGFDRDGIPCGAVFGTQPGCKPSVAAGTVMVGKLVGNSGSSGRQTKHGTPSSVILKIKRLRQTFLESVLESVLEFLLPLPDGAFAAGYSPANSLAF
jgi:hypothetical protein